MNSWILEYIRCSDACHPLEKMISSKTEFTNSSLKSHSLSAWVTSIFVVAVFFTTTGISWWALDPSFFVSGNSWSSLALSHRIFRRDNRNTPSGHFDNDNDNDNDTFGWGLHRMSTLPYGLEWGGRNLTKNNLLICCGPAQRAGCAINCCKTTGGHSHAHENKKEMNCRILVRVSHFKRMERSTAHNKEVTLPDPSPPFFQPVIQLSSVWDLDILQHVVAPRWNLPQSSLCTGS